MKSELLALLLIANLLACPARCLSCETDTAPADQSALTDCGCCSLAEDDLAAGDAAVDSLTSQTSDDCPNEDCGCQNCICEGAVIPRTVDLPQVQDWPRCWMPLTALTTADAWVADRLIPPRPPQVCGLYATGRDAQVAHQRWLI